MENTKSEKAQGDVLKERPKCADCLYIFQHVDEDRGTKKHPQCEDCEQDSFDRAFDRPYFT